MEYIKHKHKGKGQVDMWALASISLVAFVAMMLIIVIKPSLKIGKVNISIYWLPPLVGAILLLCIGYLDLAEVWAGLTANTSVNPLKILTLFISMTVLSVFLDAAGFFSYLAGKTLLKAGNSQRKLFTIIYLVVSMLTIFTSNDIVILTFTPFTCYFCKRGGINPLPYLVGEFVAANTFSMLMVIGNPTNIYIAQSMGIDFMAYLKVMWLPTLLAGITAYGVLMLIFNRQFKASINAPHDQMQLMNKPMAVVGLMALAACTILLVVAGYIAVEMWLISLCFAVGLLVVALIINAIMLTRPKEIATCLRRAPWALVPFMLSMFIIVMAMDKYKITASLAAVLGNGNLDGLTYGLASTLAANIMNNIPMSVMFASILQGGSSMATYATIIGSNLGAYLTPVGALAGIMWMNIMKQQGVKLGYGTFIKYGVVVLIPTLLAAIGGLYAVMAMY